MNKKIRIIQDNNPMSPREWDNLGTMVCWHPDYDLGDEQVSRNDAQESYESLGGDVVALPLYLYEHSGMTMRTSEFSCPWDSGQVGYIYISHKRIMAENGVSEVTDKMASDMRGRLRAEVEIYNQYLTGDVYGFQIYTVSADDHGHEHEQETDSCWGFFGSDIEANGILDHIDTNLHDAAREAMQNPQYA